ncbi:MAG: collagen-like protein [Bacteroidota bacterium]
MKKLFLFGFTAMLGMGILSLSSCGKDGADGIDGINGAKGSDGSGGATGPQGTPGANGATGATGTPGTPGSAGLKSNTVTVKDWVYDEITKQYLGFIINNNITQDVLENGMVQVFMITNDGRYVALPATFYPNAYTSYKTGFSMMLQQIRIELQYPTLTQGPLPGLISFKMVTMGKEFTSAHKTLNLSDYNQLAPYLYSGAE